MESGGESDRSLGKGGTTTLSKGPQYQILPRPAPQFSQLEGSVCDSLFLNDACTHLHSSSTGL